MKQATDHEMGRRGIDTVVRILIGGALVALWSTSCRRVTDEVPAPVTSCPLCPNGSACVADSIADDDPCDAAAGDRPQLTACDGGDDQPHHCRRLRAAQDDVRRDALINGFGVTSFPLEQVREAERPIAAYRWRPPDGATVIRCALFRCAPLFETIERDFSVTRITNYGRCVVAHRSFEPPQGTFDLRIDDGIRNADAGTACAKDDVVSTLLVGCWAYDGSHVLGATSLAPVDPSGVHNFGGLLDPRCSAADALNCVRSDGTLGTCIGHRCGKRCSTYADCLPATATTDAGVCGQTSPPRCLPAAADGVGVCEELELTGSGDAGGVPTDAATSSDGGER